MAEARRAISFGLALILASLLLAAPAWSQVRNGPKWAELSVAEKQVLAPLQPEWDSWDLLRKNKWLAMAKRYPTLGAGEQQRIHEQMQGWAKLSTAERNAAREKFKGLKQLPPDARRELPNKWMEYQSLPPTERQELSRPPVSRAPATTPSAVAQPAPPSTPAVK